MSEKKIEQTRQAFPPNCTKGFQRSSVLKSKGNIAPFRSCASRWVTLRLSLEMSVLYV